MALRYRPADLHGGLASTSLKDWPDPKGFRTGSCSWATKYSLNPELRVFDIDGNLVNPVNYETVLRPGTWIFADASMLLYVS